MIRAEIISDYETQLKTASDFVRTFIGDFSAALTTDLERTVAPNLLAGLQYEPAQKKTYVFSTPKSRRWYFWQIGLGNIPTDGRNYKRSHKLSEGYTVRVINSDGAVILSVRNPANRAWKWTKSQKFQTIGHRINGWIPDNQPVDFWTKRAKERAQVVAGQVVRSGRFG